MEPLTPNPSFLADIVVVEDTPANLRLLTQMLSQAGYKVRKVTSGELALQVLEQVIPDLVLLDIGLPGIDGYEVCQQLKACERTAAIPVIFLSAYDAASDKARAFEVGGADYITKPFQLMEVKVRVEHQLRLQSLRRQLEAQNHILQAAVRDRDAEIARRQAVEAELQAANRQLSRLVNLDGLTRIANRRWFDQSLAQEWRRLRREQGWLSLLMMDLDYFKPYNDTYGHLQGDECLKQVARTMQQCLQRPSDLLARYGGEEFTAILPQTLAPGALAVAEKLRQAVAALQRPHAASPFGIVTISIGVATLVPPRTTEPTALIQRADRALYAAKASGRNCARPAPEPAVNPNCEDCATEL